MKDSQILELADHLTDVIDQFYTKGKEEEIALEIANAIPLEALKEEGFEVLLDVAANLKLSPQSTWMLNEEIKALKLNDIINRRNGKGTEIV